MRTPGDFARVERELFFAEGNVACAQSELRGVSASLVGGNSRHVGREGDPTDPPRGTALGENGQVPAASEKQANRE
jgi:hypothetical protein